MEKVKDSEKGDVADYQRKKPEKLIYSWAAPARPFKRRDRDFWVTVTVITIIFGLILLFAEGFMPVILIISVIFLYYILSTVEPESIEYKITTLGVRMSDKLNSWKELGRFWFTKRFNDEILILEALTFGGRLEIVVNKQDKEKVKDALSEYLTHEEVPPSYLDKTTNWFSKKMPGLK